MAEKEKKTKQVQTPFRWFMSYLVKFKLQMILGLTMVVASCGIAIINPLITGRIVTDVIDKYQTPGAMSTLIKLLVFLVILTLIRSILRFSFTMLFEMASQGTLFSLREEVYRKLIHEDFNFFNRNRTGDLLSRQTGDMDSVRHFISWVLYQVLENVLLFVFALIMIFTVNVKLAFCMIIVLPITGYCTYRQSKAIKPAFARIRDRFSSLNTFAQENISGNRVVKAFAKEDYEYEKFQHENEEYRQAQLASSRVWIKFIPIFEILSTLLPIIIFLFGGYMAIQGEMTISDFIVINGYLWMLNNPLRMAGWLVNDVLRFITSLEKIYTTYKTEPDVKTPHHPVTHEKFKGNVEFNHVYYHAHDDLILRDICFKAKTGQTIGIIGATGSGKSSLVNLICRFYDANEGEVLIDGYNVKDLDIYGLRSNIGMAMQDVFLFSDTIEGNISYGDPECSFERVEEVARIANAHDFIVTMPEGYDTIVGERGVGLSGGQKQRISLARALLKNPSILILDDTTSAIDMETESQIQSALSSVATDRTVFVIAHRISSIIDADLILVMDHGRIVESGTHDELLHRGGIYNTVFNHQYGEFDRFKHSGLFEKGGN